MENGEYTVECGEWRVQCRELRVESRQWGVDSGECMEHGELERWVWICREWGV